MWYNNSIVKGITLKTTYILKFESLQGGKVNIMNKETATREEIKELIDFYNKRNELEKQTAVEKTLINITNRIQSQYENYKDFENAECDENNFECLKAILKMTFKALKSCGVDLKD